MNDLLRIILAALAITSMVSCSEKNDVLHQNETLYDLSQVRVVSEGRVYAREYIERQLTNLQQSNDLDDELAAAYDEFLSGKLEEVDEIEKQMKEDAGETENGVNTMLAYEYGIPVRTMSSSAATAPLPTISAVPEITKIRGLHQTLRCWQ